MKWFKHDTDANRDPKLEKVLMRFGAEGYALYWLCIELIAAPIDKHNLSFELEHDAEILAHRLRMDSARVEEIMRYFIDVGLFELDATTHRITCLKLANRIENSIVKNPQIKEIQQHIENDPGKSGMIRDNLGKVRLDKTRLDKTRKEKKREETPLPDGLNKQAWSDYLEHRKELGKKALTPKGQTMAANKLACLPAKQQQDVVNLSIENGWVGLFPDKFKPRQDAKSDELRSRVRLVE